MFDETKFISMLNVTLRKGENTIIESDYIPIIVDTFKNLDLEVGLTADIKQEILELFDAVIERALVTTDQSKVASMLMARLSYAKHLTIAHANIIITTVGLTFKQGNKILFNVSKYNNHINSICIEHMGTLSNLSENRRQAVNDVTKKQKDLHSVELILKQQLSGL